MHAIVAALDPFRAQMAAVTVHPWDVHTIRQHAAQFYEAGFSVRLHAEVDDRLKDR